MNQFFKELTRGNIGAALKVATSSAVSPLGYIPPIEIDPSRYTTPDGQGGWMFEMGGSQYSYFKYESYSTAVEAYKKCPPLSAIINAKAQAMSIGKTWVLDIKNEEESTSKEAKIIRELIRRPNPVQSWAQFEQQLSIFVDTFGFGIILPIKPAGFNRMLDTTSMWNIPANWIDVQLTMERFSQTGGVVLEEIIVNFGGARTVFKLKDLIIIRGSSPSFDMLTFPASKVSMNEMPVNNIIGALESRNTLINYRGALGILAQDGKTGQYNPMPIDDKEREKLQADLRRYGLRKRQFSVIVTTAALKWQQMGYATKDLMLMEEVQECSLMLCSSWNYPAFLLGLKDATYNNQRDARRGLYENCVIPDSDSIYQQLSDAFGLEDFGIKIDKDYSHIPVLQEDKKTLAEARAALNSALDVEWKTGMITLNMWREKLGEDPLPAGKGGDLYYHEYVKQFQVQEPQQEQTLVDEEGKMFRVVQSRQVNGQYANGHKPIFDNQTPSGHEI
jgi:hypothetical protein